MEVDLGDLLKIVKGLDKYTDILEDRISYLESRCEDLEGRLEEIEAYIRCSVSRAEDNEGT